MIYFSLPKQELQQPDKDWITVKHQETTFLHTKLLSWPWETTCDHLTEDRCNKSANKHIYKYYTSLPPSTAICWGLFSLHHAFFFPFNSFSLLPVRLICHRVGGLRKNKLISQWGLLLPSRLPSALCVCSGYICSSQSPLVCLLYLHTWNLAASLLAALSGWK